MLNYTPSDAEKKFSAFLADDCFRAEETGEIVSCKFSGGYEVNYYPSPSSRFEFILARINNPFSHKQDIISETAYTIKEMRDVFHNIFLPRVNANA